MTKYKSVPVTDMTIWQLGQAIHEGGEFYDVDGDKLSIINGSIESEDNGQLALSHQLVCNLITTREPGEWWEKLPKLVRYQGNGKVYLGMELDGSNLIIADGGFIKMDKCTPISREEAAEYGVE